MVGNPPQKGSLWSWQSLLLLTVTSCLLELSKSQNDMTSEKHLLAMDPRQCMGHTERRSQSDTAVNVTSRVGTVLACLLHFLLIGNLNQSGKPNYIQSIFRHAWPKEAQNLRSKSVATVCARIPSYWGG